MTWLTDLHDDIAAGLIRVVSAEEHRQQWLELQREKRRVFELHAHEMARRHNYSLSVLDHEICRRSFGSLNTTKERDELCVYQRAYAIANERQRDA